MVIQATPQTEPAQITQPDAESSQKLKPEKGELGVFARILAGLSGRGSGQGLKTGAEDGAMGAQLPGDALSAQSADSKSIANGKEKGIGAGKSTKEAATAAHEKKGILKSSKTGEFEPELVEFGLSQQEKNALLAVGRFSRQPEGDISGEESVKSAGEADSAAKRQKAARAEAVFERVTQGKTAAEPDQQTVTASSTASAAENLANRPKNQGEKTKTHGISAETLASDRKVAQETASDALLRQAEARKATGTEKEGRSRLEEARSRDRRKAVTLEVRDFRSTGAVAETGGKDGAVQLRVGAETRVPGEATSREITLELRLPNQGQESPSAQHSWEAKAGQAFESMLARELHQNFNNDIVRHASVMLRDGNEGTIKLALKPESLGNVKIRLEMAENRITGHILVESEEALRAFEREIASLEKAFRDSGFEGADLEMSLAADGREAQQQWQEAEASQSLPWQFAASRYDAADDQVEAPLVFDVYRQGARAINMLA